MEKLFLGSVLSGGNSNPADNKPETWRKFVTGFQQQALRTRLKIPLLYGIDAVHGHNNLLGAVVFPHNVGLGRHPQCCLGRTGGPRHRRRDRRLQHALGVRTPCVAVARGHPLGAQLCESFSSDPALVSGIGRRSESRLSKPLPGGFELLACTKHFAGDGGTQNGVDQGNTVGEEAALRNCTSRHTRRRFAGTRSIMVSYNSWNGQKMHGNKQLLTDVLKGEMGFKGFRERLGGDRPASRRLQERH